MVWDLVVNVLMVFIIILLIHTVYSRPSDADAAVIPSLSTSVGVTRPSDDGLFIITGNL